MKTEPPGELSLRQPSVSDGPAVWDLVRRSTLDLNSPYSYLMMFRYFADSCVIAESGGAVAGFVTGFHPPEEPDAVFVWQIGVDETWRGQGLGGRMLAELVARKPARFLEATVTPSNTASLALFRGLAKRLGAECREVPCFDASLFPGESHEAEMLLRIGPFAGFPARDTNQMEDRHASD